MVLFYKPQNIRPTTLRWMLVALLAADQQSGHVVFV